MDYEYRLSASVVKRQLRAINCSVHKNSVHYCYAQTEEGWIVRKDEPDPMKLLDELGKILAARGVTLDDLIASGRDIRGEIVREQYGMEPVDDEPNIP